MAAEQIVTDLGSGNPSEDLSSQGRQNTFVIPVVEEYLEVSKELVATGLVRVQKSVREHDVAVSEPLTAETLHVERVPMNVIVEHPPSVRTEGDVTVISVVEEVLVMTKQLRLIEEVRITKLQSTTVHQENVTLRSEQVTVERQNVGIQNEAGEERPE